jgi:hypothetical protein
MARFQDSETVGAKPIECVIHSSAADAVTIPDAHLLFSGAYKRVGPDLLIEGGGKCALLQDYFAHEHGATLLSPNGARLEPDTVRALAGQDSSWQVAQAGAGSVPPEIGTVRTLSGTASVQRGGATQPLGGGSAATPPTRSPPASQFSKVTWSRPAPAAASVLSCATARCFRCRPARAW